MTLLLDTQVALWWLMGSRRLARSARGRIAGATCLLSVASVWEVAIKYRLGKLPVAPRRFRDEVGKAGVTIIPVHDEHAIVGGELTIDHADPFDRILLATALVEGSRLATADGVLIDAAGRHRSLPVYAIA